MDEPVICNECLAEPGDEGSSQEELEGEGWDFGGEFGPRCPECVVKNEAPAQTEGLGGVVEALGATKKEP
jgi:hypothetical protein